MSAAAPTASMYAAQAPALAAARLRAAAGLPPQAAADPGMTNFVTARPPLIMPPRDPGMASFITGARPTTPAKVPMPAAGPAPVSHATTINVHPSKGITVKTAPAPPKTAPKTQPAAQAPAADPAQAPAADGLTAQLPGYMTPSQEQQYVTGALGSIYGPVASSLASLFQQRSNTLQGAINSYTPILGQLQGEYAPQSQADYGQAMQSQAAIDSMLQAALGGQGTQASAQLAHEIASTGVAAPVANALEGTQAARYQGEQGAAAARGAASLSQLLGQGVNAADYGAKLPGIAGAAGLLATRQGQAQITNDFQNSLSSLAGNEGSTAGQLYGDLRQMMNNEAMLQLYYGPRAAANQQNADTNTAKLPIDQQNANSTSQKAAAAKQKAGAYSGTYAQSAAARAAAAKRNAATNAGKLPIDQQKANALTTRAGAYAGTYANSAKTRADAAAQNAGTNAGKLPILKQNADTHSADVGSLIKYRNARTNQGPKPLSTSQADKLMGQWYNGAPGKTYQGNPIPGTGTPNVDYQTAVGRLVALGWTPAKATQLAGKYYSPGVSGRPMFTPKQTAINSQLFPTNPFAGLPAGK